MSHTVCQTGNNAMSYKFVFHYLLTKILILKVFAVLSVVDKGILLLEINSVGIKLFLDVDNENRVDTCKVYSRVKKCCLTDLDEEDCDIMYAIGETFDVIKPRDRKTLVYVFPTLCPYDLVGYCDVLLHYRCSKNGDKLHVKIPFDTTVINGRRSNPLLNSFLSNIKSFRCETLDQNSLNSCFPINCDVKYSGRRSFYDKDINRCIETPVCVGDANKDLSSVVYVPSVNVCKDLECPLSIQDIYAITTGLGTVTQSSTVKDEDRYECESNCSTITQNLYLLKDLMYGKLCPCAGNFEALCKSAVLAIVFRVISICAILLSCMFCVDICAWIHRQWSKGNIDALMTKVKSKFEWSGKKRNIPRSRINSEIRNTLLREVIIKDIPLELRDSVVSICDRMEKEVRKKKRYRKKDIGSQISLQRESARVVLSSSSSAETLCSEKDALIK